MFIVQMSPFHILSQLNGIACYQVTVFSKTYCGRSPWQHYL